jgi:PAS domain S-box-containing protein
MAKLFQSTPETLLGKTETELASGLNMNMDEVSRFLADDLEVITTRKPKSIPNETMHLWDGSVRWFQTEKIPMTLKGRAEYALGVSVDVTERKQAEEKLKALADELKLSNTELEQFAYVASHDLQEPLRMVASYVQLLARKYKGQLDADADEFIHYAVDGANRMQRLINDLLLYSRVGTKGRSFVPVDLNLIMDRVMNDLTLAVQESGAEIRRGPMPVVLADEIQMGQLLQNLIGNALKFRGDAKPVVEVGSARQGKEWLCHVKDNGIGIDPQYKERIFMIFQRLHTRDRYPGTGIGLAVCKKIVERHGGRIWVESEPDQGAAFYFTLPRKGDDLS